MHIAVVDLKSNDPAGLAIAFQDLFVFLLDMNYRTI